MIEYACEREGYRYIQFSVLKLLFHPSLKPVVLFISRVLCLELVWVHFVNKHVIMNARVDLLRLRYHLSKVFAFLLLVWVALLCIVNVHNSSGLLEQFCVWRRVKGPASGEVLDVELEMGVVCHRYLAHFCCLGEEIQSTLLGKSQIRTCQRGFRRVFWEPIGFGM